MNDRLIYESLLAAVPVPRFVRLESTQTHPTISDPELTAYHTVIACPDLQRMQSGSTVAVTVGSREVDNMVAILRGILRALKERGAHPFVVPAMGSHGGATAEGQVKVLEHYGVTEENIGVPIRSCMDTVEIGRTENGQSVHIDRIASEADFILPIGRIKPHTDFRGKAESGIMKMMAIGLGKQYGASLCHKLGFPRMGESVWHFGHCVLQNARILLGVAVIENAEHHTALIEAIEASRIPQRESELLDHAKSLMPRIPFKDPDVLLVSEIGKDISGAGMDPNVTGRSCSMGSFWPFAEKIAVFDITDVSDGNAAGIGNADAITRQLAERLNTLPMYINSITCRDTQGVRIPTIMETEELAYKYLAYTCIRRDAVSHPRVVWIRNTANLHILYASEALVASDGIPKDYRAVSKPMEVVIDNMGKMSFEEQWI